MKDNDEKSILSLLHTQKTFMYIMMMDLDASLPTQAKNPKTEWKSTPLNLSIFRHKSFFLSTSHHTPLFSLLHIYIHNQHINHSLNRATAKNQREKKRSIKTKTTTHYLSINFKVSQLSLETNRRALATTMRKHEIVENVRETHNFLFNDNCFFNEIIGGIKVIILTLMLSRRLQKAAAEKREQ